MNRAISWLCVTEPTTTEAPEATTPETTTTTEGSTTTADIDTSAGSAMFFFHTCIIMNLSDPCQQNFCSIIEAFNEPGSITAAITSCAYILPLHKTRRFFSYLDWIFELIKMSRLCGLDGAYLTLLTHVLWTQTRTTSERIRCKTLIFR